MLTNCLRTTRLEQGLSRQEVANRASLSVDAIALIEDGKRYGRPTTQRAIAAALGVPGRDLFPL